ncbi:hypothetical protein HZ326_26891 [Fusarium oxysporum f. sp. albedinis]|nr:hypothetical protein HZ326_26891 [Fusarium oxysporum f. sp. albedinis]
MSAPFGLAVMVTNWIPNSFVQSCHESKLFYLTAAYSRQLNTANKFISETPSIKDASRVEAYNDLDTMLSKGSNIDVVYIASPNSLHCEQGVKALNAGKHVIMQKPFASNMKELEALYELADSKVTSSWKLIGTFKSPTSRDFRDYLMMRKPEQRNITKNNVPNVAFPKFSGGCLWDMGCYPVTFAVRLFGKPSIPAALIIPNNFNKTGLAATITSFNLTKEQDHNKTEPIIAKRQVNTINYKGRDLYKSAAVCKIISQDNYPVKGKLEDSADISKCQIMPAPNRLNSKSRKRDLPNSRITSLHKHISVMQVRIDNPYST